MILNLSEEPEWILTDPYAGHAVMDRARGATLEEALGKMLNSWNSIDGHKVNYGEDIEVHITQVVPGTKEAVGPETFVDLFALFHGGHKIEAGNWNDPPVAWFRRKEHAERLGVALWPTTFDVMQCKVRYLPQVKFVADEKDFKVYTAEEEARIWDHARANGKKDAILSILKALVEGGNVDDVEPIFHQLEKLFAQRRANLFPVEHLVFERTHREHMETRAIWTLSERESEEDALRFMTNRVRIGEATGVGEFIYIQGRRVPLVGKNEYSVVVEDVKKG